MLGVSLDSFGSVERPLLELDADSRVLDGRLGGMDSVRFGRALGVGVREAAKAAVKAAEAAAAPAPEGAAVAPVQAQRPATQERVRETVRQTQQTAKGLKQGGKKFGEAVWVPFAKLSGVLWHEVMGVLFGLFVLVAGAEAWHGRAELMRGAGRAHEWGAVAMVVVFGFFMGSSFVKASRRGRR